MIGIVEYGSGNIGAISNIYRSLKIPHFISSDSNELSKADRFILPGVGAFDTTMRHLKDSGLENMLCHHVQFLKKPILGICVGMQILAESSDEGSERGLGWIKGHVKKIDSSFISTKLKLPHMGWNSIACQTNDELFIDVDYEIGFYFLHNYFFDAADSSSIIGRVSYGLDFPCAVRNENVFGVQFHPEKSHHNGVNVFKNFARYNVCSVRG